MTNGLFWDCFGPFNMSHLLKVHNYSRHGEELMQIVNLLVAHVVPVNPGMHVHVNVASPSAHAAPFRQGSVAQSSGSGEVKWGFQSERANAILGYIKMQTTYCHRYSFVINIVTNPSLSSPCIMW